MFKKTFVIITFLLFLSSPGLALAKEKCCNIAAVPNYSLQNPPIKNTDISGIKRL
jgi:hypothetical protein